MQMQSVGDRRNVCALCRVGCPIVDMTATRSLANPSIVDELLKQGLVQGCYPPLKQDRTI